MSTARRDAPARRASGAPSTSTTVVQSGWLTKRGGKDLYGKATWRLRYFVLRRPRHARERACVRYFANEPADPAESAAKTEFAINGRSAVRILDTDEAFAEYGLKAHKYAGKRIFAFQTMPGDYTKGNTLVVEAEDLQTLQRWVTALSEAIAAARSLENEAAMRGGLAPITPVDEVENDVLRGKNYRGTLERAGLCGPLGGGALPVHLDACWENMTFVDLMADSCLNATIGRSRRPKYVRETLTSLIDSAITIGKCLGALPLKMSSAESNAVSAIRRALEDMLSLARVMPVGARDNNLFVSFLSALLDRVKQLRAGEIIMIPGGWANEEGGAAVIFTIHRLPQHFVVSVTNCGDGLEYHPIQADPAKDAFRYINTIQLMEVPIAIAMDSAAWALLFRPLIFPQEADKAKDMIYNKVLPMMNGRPLMASVTPRPLRTTKFAKPPRGQDSSGVFTALEAARCGLASLGCPPARADALVNLGVRYVMLEEARRDLERIEMIGASALVTLQAACRTVAEHAANHADVCVEAEETASSGEEPKKAAVSRDTLSQVLRSVEAVMQRTKSLHSTTTLPPALSPPKVAMNACALPLFNRLTIEGNVDALAGAARMPPIIRPVELTSVPDAVADLSEVPKALRNALHCCTILANQADLMPNSYALRVSLLSHLFLHVLPAPLPITHPERDSKCFWASAQTTYEVQAEILRSLNLLLRHFSAASLSISVTQTFDAARLLTVANFAAIADATLRLKVFDAPSAFMQHYAGYAQGPISAFGFEIGPFAVEAEYLRFHCPERTIRLTQTLDYFHSLKTTIKEDHMIYRWENERAGGMSFGIGEARLIDQVCLQMGTNRDDPEYLAKYHSSQLREFVDEYPEMSALRDIIFMFKLLMAPTSDDLPELARWKPIDAALEWSVIKREGFFDLEVHAFGRSLKIQPWSEPIEEGIPVKTGWRNIFGGGFFARAQDRRPRCPPSGANPSNLAGERIDTEEDVLHLREVPTFDNLLKPSESELLLTYLTAPMIRLPLVMKLFSDPSRVRSLTHDDIQSIMDAVMFEPGPWAPPEQAIVPQEIPAPTRAHMAAPCGLLVHELINCPAPLADSAEELLTLSLELDTGRHDAPSAQGVMFACRMLTRLLAFVNQILKANSLDAEFTTSTGVTRGLDCSQAAVTALKDVKSRINKALTERCRPVLQRWLRHAVKKNAIRAACALHAHLAYMYYWTPRAEIDKQAALTILTAQQYIFVNYSFVDTPDGSETTRRKLADNTNMSGIDTGLGFTPTEVFDLFQRKRRSVLEWAAANPQDANSILESIVKTLTTKKSGGTQSPTNVLDSEDTFSAKRSWRRAPGEGGAGRFVSYVSDVPFSEIVEQDKRNAEYLLQNHQHYGEWLLETTLQSFDMEINTQLGEFTVRKNRLRHLDAHIREMPDFVAAMGPVLAKRGIEPSHFQQLSKGEELKIGDSGDVIHCAEVKNTEHRTWMRLVGLSHDVQLWDRDPRPPSNEYTRPLMTQVQTNVQALEILGRAVGAGGLEPCEQWITALLDPIVKGPGAGYLHGVELFLPKHTIQGPIARLAGTGAPDNASSEPWSFWWKSKEKRDDDDQRRVEEAKQLLTEVVIVREPPLVQVFRVESYGRRWRRSLVFASNASFCLADIDPDGEPILKDESERFLLSAARLGSRAPSLVITRHLNGSIGRESFVPVRHLRGLLPQALLEEYQFWRSESTGDLFGSPNERASKQNTMIHVRLGYENNGLLDGGHAVDTRAIVRRLPTVRADGSPQLPPLDGSYVEGQLTLVDLLYSPALVGDQGKSLLSLTKSLAAVEGLAHSLVWSSKRGLEDAQHQPCVEVCDISRVELPRLGVSFNAIESGGSIRLECEEHAGLFLAQRRNATLEKLLTGLPHALLLEARDGALSVLLSASAIPRPAATTADAAHGASTGLGSDLIIDRWSTEWVENIGSTKHYVYPVHPSHAIISATSMAAALYLASLRFIGRDYLAVLRLAELCVSEAQPTAEEAQLWDALVHAASLDPSPDATAVRVKLALMVKDTPIEPRIAAHWPPVADVLAYVNAWPYVNANCRLTGHEELSAIESLGDPDDIQKKKRSAFKRVFKFMFPGARKASESDMLMNPRQTPVLVNRAAYLRQLVSGIARMSAGSTPTSSGFPIIFPPTPSYSKYDDVDDLTCLSDKVTGEGPLGKLAGLIQTYNRPDDVSVNGSQALALIGKWIDKEKFNLDGNLGFPLLFELLTGTLPMRILPGDTPHRCGCALLRFVPEEQSMKRGTLMSTLRVLAACPQIAQDCPRMEEQSVGQRFSAMFTSDGAIGQLLRKVRPYLQRRKEEFPVRVSWTGKEYVHASIYESSVQTWARTIATGGRWALTRFMNTSCSERDFPLETATNEMAGGTAWSGRTLQHVDLDMLVKRPLGVLDLNKFIVPMTEDREDELAQSVALGGVGGLPFDVTQHPAGTTPIARQMLNRLRADVSGAAEKARERKANGDFSAVTLKGFCPSDTAAIAAEAGAGRAGAAAATARSILRELLEGIRRVTADDKTAANEAMSAALATANGLRKDVESGTKMLRLGLQRRAGAWAEVTFEDLIECLTCDGGEHILSRLSPDVSAKQIVDALHLTSQALLLTLRATLAARAAAMVADTLIALTNCAKAAAVDGIDSVDRDLRLRALAIAQLISVERHYFKTDSANPFSKATSLMFDPRLLVYEYSQSIVLRKRQVELTRDFVATAENGGGQCAQMLMGEGKTTVVCPLLGFILAKSSSLVVQVVPHALLEFSRSTQRKAYSGVIRRSVVTLEFNRYTSLADGAILGALRKAKENRAIVIASPTSIKSLALKFLEVCHLLDQSYIAMRDGKTGGMLARGTELVGRMFTGAKSRSERVADAGGLTVEEMDHLRAEALAAAEIFEIFQTGTLILDEVDLILHPLKSELNWPMGRRIPLDFSQSESGDGFRWKLPYFILDAIFAVTYGRSTASEAEGSQEATDLLEAIREVVKKAIAAKQLQTSPHLVLLDKGWYAEVLRPLLAQWTSIWLRAHGGLRGMSDAHTIAYLVRGPGEAEAKAHLNRESSDEATKMTNLARDWLCSLLPHMLAKVDRVTFGLLQPDDVELLEKTTGQTLPKTRKLLAVPFVGKDIPSRTNEFSHPDVVLGLTMCAYRLEGFRRSDFKQLLRILMEEYDNEAGPPVKRPSARLWADWIRTTGKRVRGEARAEAALNARRRGVSQQAGVRDIGDIRGLAWLEEESGGLQDDEIWPLQLIDLRDHDQIEELYQLLKKTPPCIEYYLNEFIFPETAQHQNLKLSATGQELGGDVLFPNRLGFSGTPSDLLPLELGAPRYESGSDAKMLAYLTDPQTAATMPLENEWNVDTLLTRIATADPPIRALIDTGALVTGMSNLMVARFLLENGLAWAEGCVFLDENDKQMILMRKGWEVIPLQRVAAMPLTKRFSFYDQVHTTGMDIKQSAAAQAAITLGKDMVLRDYAQGAWRMRGLGRGQTLKVVVIPEVARLISAEVSKGCGQVASVRESELATMSAEEVEKRKLRDISAWLIVNSMRSENIQAGLLAEQRTANIWRKHSYRKLIAAPTVPGTPKADGMIHACLDVFRDRVSYVVANVIPTAISPSEKLAMSVQQFGHLVDDNPQARDQLHALVNEVKQMEETTNLTLRKIRAGVYQAHGSIESGDQGLAGGVEHALDLEQVQENEEEQENEQEQEQEKEEEREEEIIEEAPAGLKYVRDDERQICWNYDTLSSAPTKGAQGFYPLKKFKIHKGVGKTTAPLDFPSYLYLSRNYFREGWALNGHRRLKNLTIVLDWVPNSTELTTDTNPGVGSFTVAQESALRTAFDMFDTSGDGRLQVKDLQEVLREIDACVEDDELRLQQLAREVAEESRTFNTGMPSSGTSFEELKRVLRTKNIYSLQRGRYYVALSLAEAESLRVVMHLTRSNASSDGKLLPFKPTEAALRIGGGTLLDTTSDFGSAQVFQGATAEQCFRFLDSQLDFEDREVSLLLRALQGSPCDKRAEFFESVRACRRRAKIPWASAPLAKVLTTPDEFHLLASRALVARVRTALQSKRMRLLDAFRAFDSENIGRLTYEALYGGLSWLGLSLSSAQMLELAARVDKTNDGYISREEFEDAFGPDDDWILDGGDFQPQLALPPAVMQSRPSVAPTPTSSSSKQVSLMDLLGDDSSAQVTTTSSDRVADPMTSAPPPPPPPPPKVTSTENLSIDDVTGLSDWGALGMAATLPTVAKKQTSLATAAKPSASDPFGLGPPAGASSTAFDDWLTGGSGDVPGGGKLSDPLGASPPSKPSDGWEGSDMIQLDTSTGSIAAPAREKIQARALVNPVREAEAKKNASVDSKLNRDALNGFQVTVVHQKSFSKVWTSDGTGSRSTGSVWEASLGKSTLKKKSERCSLGHYASPHFSQPKPAPFAVEVTDVNAYALTGSAYMPRVLQRLFPHPSRFRQVWGQEWKGTALYAWTPVPPPGFVAVGMVLTKKPQAPDVSSVRCLPEQWAIKPTMAPQLVWTNEGSGGRPASIWLVNSLGLLYVNIGHNPPAARDLWDIKRGKLTADQILQHQFAAPSTTYATTYGGTGISSDDFGATQYVPPAPPRPQSQQPSSSGAQSGGGALAPGLGSLI